MAKVSDTKKKAVKKTMAKKVVVKKPVAKKNTSTKTTAKKVTSKKSPIKKATTATKKTTVKKAAAKKPAARKTAATKTTAKKVTSKKSPTKKATTATKKTTAKKTVAKKPAARKTVATKTTAKKVVPKKSSTKKVTVATKKAAAKKVSQSKKNTNRATTAKKATVTKKTATPRRVTTAKKATTAKKVTAAKKTATVKKTTKAIKPATVKKTQADSKSMKSASKKDSGIRYNYGGKIMDNKGIKKLESDLWESADLLRAGSKLTSQQYCMPVLGLLFLRYAYSRFKKVEEEILKDRPVRNGRVIPIEQSDFAEKSALYLPKEAQYAYLVNLPADIKTANIVSENGQPMNSLGEVVNHAMELVEAQSEQLAGVLPKDYTIFSDDLLAELLRIFNNNALDEVGGDVIGRIYEYFLSKFAPVVASDDGVFFTPKSLVKMIVNILEPSSGVLADIACGSGGMFVQSGDFVNSKGMSANKSMTFYGQEKVEYNAQLCLMNMAVHGLTGVIKSGDEANTFYNDAHNLAGCCDYVMANPPFNVDKVKAEATQNAGRLPFGLPGVNKAGEIGNANYLWISYFYSYLNEQGRAGFVMASSATDSQGKDKDIRQKLVETGHVDVMISVGNNFFYTKSLPCSLWFFDKGKSKELKDQVLFIDARNYFTVVDRTLNEWSEWQLKNMNAIVWLYRGEKEKYKALLKEYHDVLGKGDFESILNEQEDEIRSLRNKAKDAVEKADKKEKKKVQAEYDEKIAEQEEYLTVAKEAVWLYSKFGNGEYQDVLGLCKIADRSEIEEKGWSLTPGAYVGVAPVEDDGVDFNERMGEIHEELLILQKESNKLMETISRNMKEMGI